MPRGISLHVGINQVSSAFPGAAKLTGPENDAREMEKIAVANGFFPHDLLVGPDATYARVTTKIRAAAAELEGGDFFLFTFAGHGFQQVSTGIDLSSLDLDDGLDETILLFDVELFDDVLGQDLWPCFKSGVRVLMISDCCHSGDNFLIAAEENETLVGDNEFPVATHESGVRGISIGTGVQHRKEYAQFYQNISVPLVAQPITARLMLLAACKAKDKTLDGDPNGMYTAAMLKMLKLDPPTYNDLVNWIQTELINAGRINQVPTIQVDGLKNPDFRKEKPFTI